MAPSRSPIERTLTGGDEGADYHGYSRYRKAELVINEAEGAVAFGFGWLRRHGDGENIVPEVFDSLDICAENKSGGLADKNKDESSFKEKCLQNVG